jgi:hypothetical protein
MSRRSVLQSAAGAGLAVTAVTALGVAATAATTATANAATAPSAGSGTAANSPLVVHVRDLKTGDIEVFSGTTQTRVRDRALAARIAQAIN